MTTAGAFMDNAVYEGVVEHRRHVERPHAFKYSLYMLWLRVSEVDDPKASWPLISRAAFAPVSVCQGDYLAHRSEASLKDRLAAEIKEKTQGDWDGEAFMLANPRHFGFVMNPLALYYCFNKQQNLVYIVGEITNTPWGERHCYVFDMMASQDSKIAKFSFKKTFHVSPFLPMEMDYTWNLSQPGKMLTVNIWNRVESRVDFEAHLMLARRSLSGFEILRQMVLRPLMTFKVWLGIYVNAGILYAIKRVRFYDHPKLKEGGPS